MENIATPRNHVPSRPSVIAQYLRRVNYIGIGRNAEVSYFIADIAGTSRIIRKSYQRRGICRLVITRSFNCQRPINKNKTVAYVIFYIEIPVTKFALADAGGFDEAIKSDIIVGFVNGYSGASLIWISNKTPIKTGDVKSGLVGEGTTNICGGDYYGSGSVARVAKYLKNIVAQILYL